MKEKVLDSKSNMYFNKMHILLACCLYLLTGYLPVYSQDPTIGTIQIGSGTTTITGSNALPVTNYNYTYSQQIVSASEYGAGLGVAGPITKMRYYVENLGTLSVWDDWTVYIGNTTKTEFTSNTDWIPLSELTQVFSGTITATANNWLEITLDQPFNYTGGNLVVAVDENKAGWSSAPSFRSYTSTDNAAIVFRSDTQNPDPTDPPTATGRRNQVPQLQFEGPLTDCLPPINLQHDDISANEVEINFENAIPSGVEYVLTTVNTPPTSGGVAIAVGTESVTLTDLEENTTYYFWYKRTCESGSGDFWLNYSFTTICGIVDNFYENFESTPTGTSTNITLPICWSYINTVESTSSAYGYVSTTASYNTTGSRGYYTYRSSTASAVGDLMLVSPRTNNLGNGTKQLRFRAKKSTASYVPKFEIYTLDGTTATANKTLVQEVILSTDYNEYIVYLPNTTDDFFAFSFDKGGTTASYVYLDDVYYEDAPSCIPVTSITIDEVLKHDATLSWSPTITTSNATYTWELRTSGNPGSADGLVQTGTTLAGVTSVTIEDLDASTHYYFYVRANCLADDSSTWDELGINFITLCDYPDLVEITSDVICGIGSASLLANFTDNSTVNWYAQAEGGESLFTGTNFTTPLVDTTTIYYVDATSAVPYTRVQVGEGASTANSYQNPFYSLWSNSHTQYLITAEELIAAGLTTGNIYSVALDITSAGTLPMKDLSVKIGTTTATDMTTFVDNTNFATVYTNSSLMPETGVNILTFNTPFVWDGTSNIVLEFCHGNEDSTATMSRITRADATDYVSVIKTHKTSSTAGSVICGDTTSNVATYSLRPVFIFNDTELCTSPRIPVEVVVTPSEDFTLEVDEVTVCQGNYTEPIFIETGDDVYDTYTWYPSEFVTGDEENGFVFFGNTSTLYTVIASQSDGECAKAFEIQVNVSSLGYEPLEESYIVCADGVQALSIYPNEIDVSVLPYETLRHYTFEGNTMGDLTLTNANGSTLHYYTDAASEGNTSLRWEYANTSGVSGLNPSAHLETGTLDASGSYGLLVEFDNVSYMENCCDFGYLMYSLDGGINWEVFTPEMYYGEATPATHATYPHIRFKSNTYTEWGNPASGVLLTTNDLWKREVFMIPAEGNDLSNVKIRFAVRSDGSGLRTGWYLDNIQIKKVDLPEVEWSPVQHLYLDAELTQPYAGESVGTVYFNHNESGNYNYSVTIENDMISCVSTISTEVVIPELTFPGLTNSYYCSAVDVNDLEYNQQNGVQYIWYDTIAAEDPIDIISTSGVYFVQIVTEECSSGRQPVQVNILTGVNLTVDTTQYSCEGNTIASLQATPSQSEGVIQWFASANDTIPLDMSTEVSSGTYYVNQNLFGCESEKIAVNVIVDEIPESLSTTNLTVCSNTTIGSISIEGLSNLKWYTSITSTTPLANQAILTSGVYYITPFVNACEAPRVAVNVEVIVDLPQLQASVINICGTGTVADLNAHVTGVVNGAQVEWYVSTTATTPLLSNEVLYTGTYYAVQRISECESVKRAVAVRVNSVSAPIINAQQVCKGTTIADIEITSPSGVTYQWYSSPSSTQIIDSSTELLSNTYYVRRLQNGCLSEPATVQVMVIDTPATPTGEIHQVLEQGSTIEDIIINGSNLVWYASAEDAINGNNPLEPYMPLSDGITYYAVDMNTSGCASLPLAVTIELFLGLNDLDLSKLKVYPNPTYDVINISYKDLINRIEIYSMSGQLVLSSTINLSEATVDLSTLSEGVYMLKMYVGTSSQFVKIVKK